jgi:phospholipid transport system substrate-binding protein
MRIPATVSLALLGLVASVSAADMPAAPNSATPKSPHELIRQTGDELIGVIKAGKTYFDSDPDRFYKAVQDVLEPVVDFDSFSKGVMAANYKRATPEQRERFRGTFKYGLIHTYAKALLNYGDEKIEVLPPSRPAREPDRDSVTMQVWSEGKAYPVEYSMHLDSDGHWRMGNIIINGINIGLTYRNQFATAMSAPENNGDMDKVIDSWANTVANVDPMGKDQPKDRSQSAQVAP